MINLRKITIYSLLMGALFNLMSCGVDRWPEYAQDIKLGNWMDSIMRKNYLWYEDMPSYNNVNLFLTPKEFLSKVISKKDNNISFADSIIEVTLPSYGFEYSLVRDAKNDTVYNALLTYIVPNSPASKAGLKRGEWIMKVNDRFISRKYETQLLQSNEALTLTVGVYKEVTPASTDPEKAAVYEVVKDREGVALGTAESVIEEPIYTHQMITLADGKKVGYLMYNSCTAGTTAEPEKYNNELKEIAKTFSQSNINTLIVDLRRNQGGSLSCAQLLSTILAPTSYLNKDMAYLNYNNKNTDRDKTLLFDSKLLANTVNLNLNTILFITSNQTTGAAETIINGLNKKVPQLITIGATTKGQNIGTEKFTNTEFRWSINPAVCKISYDADRTLLGGVIPTYAVSETSNYIQYLPFGDINETLLNIAIKVLEGTYPPQTSSEAKTENHLRVLTSQTRSVFATGLRVDN